MKMIEAGRGMYHDMQMRAERIEANVKRIEEHPIFKRQCEVLEMVEAEFNKASATEKEGMWQRFERFFDIHGFHDDALDKINLATMRAVYKGAFNRHKLATDLAHAERGGLGQV